MPLEFTREFDRGQMPMESWPSECKKGSNMDAHGIVKGRAWDSHRRLKDLLMELGWQGIGPCSEFDRLLEEF